jgi:hypothetical protein
MKVKSLPEYDAIWYGRNLLPNIKMSGDIYPITQHHIPETHTLKTRGFWL